MFVVLKKPALVKIFIIPFVAMIIGSMVWAIAVLYALDLGANIFQVNLITTIQSTMGIILMVPFGILSDRFGRRPMLLYSRMLIIIGILISAFATEPNHLLLSSLFGAFSVGGFWPILLSMIGDVAKIEERQVAVSTMYLFSGVGMFIGPIISSSLLTLLKINLRNIYQIVLVAQIAVLVYLATQIRETKHRTPKNEKIQYHLYLTNLIRQSTFQCILIIIFLYFFSRSIIQTYIPIYARVDLGLSNAEVASFSIYRSLAILLIRFSSATFLTKVSFRSFLISALGLGGITCLASPFANNYLWIVLVFFLSGVSFGAERILTAVLVADNSTPENRGVANGFYYVAQSTGNMTIILTSPIADSLGFTPVFILGGISGLITTLPVLLRKVDR